MKNKKTLIITVAGVAVVIAVLTIVAYIVMNAGDKIKGGDGSNSPYTIETKRDGKVIVTLNTNKIKKGGKWSIDTGEQSKIKVKSSKKRKKQIYTFTPEEEGDVNAYILCTEQNEIDEPVFELTLELSVSADKKITVNSDTASDIERAKHGGEGTKHPYIYRVDESGIMQIYLDGEEDDNWYMQIGDDSFTAEGPVYDDGKWMFTVKGSTESEKVIYIYSADQNMQISFSIKSDANGVITVDSTDTSEYKMEKLPGQDEYEALLGKQTMPEGVNVYEYNVTDWMTAAEGQEPEKATDSAGKIGMADVNALGNKVTYIMSDEVSADQIISVYSAMDVTAENVELSDGIQARYVKSGRDTAIVWQKDNTCYGILADGMDKDTIKSIAELFLGGGQNE